jgi:membrane protease YdiL (CAAX protease family)
MVPNRGYLLSQCRLCCRMAAYPLATYFVLAYAWTWLCWGLVIASSKWQLSLPMSEHTLATLGQFGPFASAVFVIGVTHGRDGLRDFANRFLRWRAHPAWLFVSLCLLPATMLAAIYWHAYLGGLSNLKFHNGWATLPWHFAYMLVLGGPLGEEPGWRGFALPRLQERYGPILGSLWLGLLGAGWHLPLWWMYPPPCPFWMFVAGAILLSLLFTWLLNHTRESVLYSLLFHTSLSIGSVRLPDAPAYHLWLLVLISVVAIILIFDRRLGHDKIAPDR